jgi:hypothetical protein
VSVVAKATTRADKSAEVKVQCLTT